MQTDAYFEAQQTVDILDDNGGVAQSIDTMISQSDTKRRQEMIERITHQDPAPVAAPAPVHPVADPYATLQPSAPDPQSMTALDQPVSFNPYPTSMHQSVVTPLSEQPAPVAAPAPPTTTTSEKPLSPDIINLATTADLSIETIAHEAKRIQQKEQQLNDDEVVISLR
jgi:hypothetical protein